MLSGRFIVIDGTDGSGKETQTRLLIELRTTPQGHPSYRKVCQEMHKAIAARSPWRAGVIKFADHNDYFWSRADSEARQRAEEAQLDRKQGLA